MSLVKRPLPASSPITPQSGWTTGSVTSDRGITAETTTLNEVAQVLSTLIIDLKAAGVLTGPASGSAMGALGITYP